MADKAVRIRAYRFGSWELNVGLRKLKSASGKTIDLTNGEFSLLTAFLSAPQRTLNRDELLEPSPACTTARVYDRSIDVQILRLRRKIECDPSNPQYICTQRGAGYVFRATVEKVRQGPCGTVRSGNPRPSGFQGEINPGHPARDASVSREPAPPLPGAL